MMCADMVEASWVDQAGQTERADAILENISPRGACLQFEVAVPPGVTLRFSAKNHEFSGEVRYCQYAEIGYFVGIEFEPQSHWSKSSFKPSHLLDLEELVASKRR
jgi:hypothetical protein